MVREKVEEHKQKEENERLKQELRAVKIQLSKQPGMAVAQAATPWERLPTLGTRSDFCGFPSLCVEDYQSTYRPGHHQGLVLLSDIGYNDGIFVCSHHFIYCW